MRSIFLWIYLFPRNFFVVLLRGYRLIFSPLYGEVCRYYPSCSLYSLHAFQVKGFILGVAMTFYRIIRCHPWSSGGLEDVSWPKNSRFRITPFGFVVDGK